jgi:hypothetical protein
VLEGPAGRAALQVRSVTRYGPGAVSRLVPPDDEVHAMHNPTARDTLEIHVYGATSTAWAGRHGLPTAASLRW